jgi:ArsR family transcriptional regulator
MKAYSAFVNLIAIYQCLCDETRLRILHVLSKGPLCVCHFQEALAAPQVKISKHLNYLKRRKMVETRRFQNWRIYELPRKRSRELELHLKCLQDCAQEQAVFKEDLRRLQRISSRAKKITEACPSC